MTRFAGNTEEQFLGFCKKKSKLPIYVTDDKKPVRLQDFDSPPSAPSHGKKMFTTLFRFQMLQNS